MIVLTGKVKIIRADSAGACYGVTRALNLASSACETCEHVCTLGEIIHNPIVVSELSEKGAKAIGDVSEATGTVILRSHGVKPEVERKLSDAGCSLIDATCPHVKRAQLAAKKMAEEGREVIVVGESGHPEVESIVAYVKECGGSVKVVLNSSEIGDIADRVGVVCQTTQKKRDFDLICEAARSRCSDVVVQDTICQATEKRQTSAHELATKCSIVIVLGGKNSSNTKRLFEICSSKCPDTYYIEKPQELPVAQIKKKIESEKQEFIIGITAGASTPISHIERLEKFLRDNL